VRGVLKGGLGEWEDVEFSALFARDVADDVVKRSIQVGGSMITLCRLEAGGADVAQ
jgi:hypothetical protein